MFQKRSTICWLQWGTPTQCLTVMCLQEQWLLLYFFIPNLIQVPSPPFFCPALTPTHTEKGILGNVVPSLSKVIVQCNTVITCQTFEGEITMNKISSQTNRERGMYHIYKEAKNYFSNKSWQEWLSHLGSQWFINFRSFMFLELICIFLKYLSTIILQTKEPIYLKIVPQIQLGKQ